MRTQKLMYFHWDLNLPYVLSAKPRCRIEIMVHFFFSVSDTFCEIKVVNFPCEE